MIHGQSPDIAQGVDESFDAQAGATDPLDRIGAGDQGMMFWLCHQRDACLYAYAPSSGKPSCLNVLRRFVMMARCRICALTAKHR